MDKVYNVNIVNKNNIIYLQNEFMFVSFKSKNFSNNINNLLIFLYILEHLNPNLNITTNSELIINQMMEFFPNNILMLNQELKFSTIKFHDLIQPMIFKTYTLTFIKNKDKILLGKKKRGFGKDYYNGFGGKVQSNETIQQAAKREIFEECKLIANNLYFTGKLYFSFVDSNNPNLEGYVFTCNDFINEPKETEEMQPQWFIIPEQITKENIKNILIALPFDKMWEDDIYWFIYMLKSIFFKGYFILDNQNQLKNFILEIYDKPLICKGNASS